MQSRGSGTARVGRFVLAGEAVRGHNACSRGGATQRYAQRVRQGSIILILITHPSRTSHLHRSVFCSCSAHACSLSSMSTSRVPTNKDKRVSQLAGPPVDGSCVLLNLSLSDLSIGPSEGLDSRFCFGSAGQ